MALFPLLQQQKVQSLAVCLLHGYMNPAHEQRIKSLVLERFPEMRISLSSEVSPEMREYERFSTTAANAYIQPLISGYLVRLEHRLRESGFACPLFLLLSGGGLATVETARRFPIRMVESGPTGGAMFASVLAAQYSLDHVLSFDMGGTTAKICFIDDGQPQGGRQFEIARVYRFKKGSGLPVRIPVIEMVEIGAGGGSIAQIDSLDRIQVGPESAGSEPGPACFGFLCAPSAYEIVRSLYQRISTFNPAAVNSMFAEMQEIALAVVKSCQPQGELVEKRRAFMRYTGQGHEIAVDLPLTRLAINNLNDLQDVFENEYTSQYGRVIPNVDIEILSWSLSISESRTGLLSKSEYPSETSRSTPSLQKNVLEHYRDFFDPESGSYILVPVYRRSGISPGFKIKGPAVISERDTTTIVPKSFEASVDSKGNLFLEKTDSKPKYTFTGAA